MPAVLLTGLRFLGSLATRGGTWLAQKTPSLVRSGGRSFLSRGGNFITRFLNQPSRPPEYDQQRNTQTTTHKILGDHPLLFALLTVAVLPIIFFYALYEIIINATPWTTGLN